MYTIEYTVGGNTKFHTTAQSSEKAAKAEVRAKHPGACLAFGYLVPTAKIGNYPDLARRFAQA